LLRAYKLGAFKAKDYLQLFGLALSQEELELSLQQQEDFSEPASLSKRSSLMSPNVRN